MALSGEHAVRHWVLQHWGGWAMRIEPGLGTAAGAPDLLLAWEGQMRLLELKRAKRLTDRLLEPEDVRASQHSWHYNYTHVTGMRSGYLVGVTAGGRGSGPHKAFYVDPDVMRDHYRGVPLDRCTQLSSEPKQFTADLVRVLFT